jgi:hypothetical protein
MCVDVHVDVNVIYMSMFVVHALAHAHAHVLYSVVPVQAFIPEFHVVFCIKNNSEKFRLPLDYKIPLPYLLVRQRIRFDLNWKWSDPV